MQIPKIRFVFWVFIFIDSFFCTYHIFVKSMIKILISNKRRNHTYWLIDRNQIVTLDNKNLNTILITINNKRIIIRVHALIIVAGYVNVDGNVVVIWEMVTIIKLHNILSKDIWMVYKKGKRHPMDAFKIKPVYF